MRWQSVFGGGRSDFARDGVDPGGCGYALIEQQAGLVEVGDEEAVDDESRAVGTHDDHLSQRLAVLHCAREGLSTRRLGGDDLDETILGWVVEEMQPDEAVRTSGGHRQVVHREGGCVGCEDGGGSAHVVQGSEDALLDVEVLEHSLDHQIGVRAHVLRSDHTGDARLDRFHLLRPEDAPFDRFREEVGDGLLAALHPLLLTVHHLDVELLLCALLRDAAAHVAGTDDGDALDRLHGRLW